MKHKLFKLINRHLRKSIPVSEDISSDKLGFQGDVHYQELANTFLEQCSYFIETGSSNGCTTSYVAKNFPKVEILSCEPDEQRYKKACENTINYGNVKLFKQLSQEFIETIKEKYSGIYNDKILFFLDAHGYGFDWPLKEEIEFITSNFPNAAILIDDFLVPGYPNFGYDIFEPHICSYDYIKDSFRNDTFDQFYPCYMLKTSPYYPLRGWGLFTFGKSREIKMKNSIIDKILKVK